MGEMVKDPNCAYCVEGELLAKFGYPCCEMKTGKLYVFKEQSKSCLLYTSPSPRDW